MHALNNEHDDNFNLQDQIMVCVVQRIRILRNLEHVQ